MKKDLGKIIASVLVLAICLGLANVTGLDIRGFISNFHIDLESLLKVLIIVTGLLSIGYLLKFLVSLIRAPKLATLVTILRSGIDYAMLSLIVVWSLRVLGADINGIIAGLGIWDLVMSHVPKEKKDPAGGSADSREAVS